MKANAKTEIAVNKLMDKFLKSYRNRDIVGLMSLIPDDDDQIMYGTGADEKRIGRDQIKLQAERDWSQTDEIAFELTSRDISAAGPVAWVAADGIGKGKAGGQAFEFPFRMTAVFEERGNDWFLVQSHISIPSVVQEEGNSVPV